MADDYQCHHDKVHNTIALYHHNGHEYCSEKCFHDCIARYIILLFPIIIIFIIIIYRKAEHNRTAAKGEIGHQEHHEHHRPGEIHTGKKLLDHHDHGNVITGLNPRYANNEGHEYDISHEKFSGTKKF